jgi:hypothetical protein
MELRVATNKEHIPSDSVDKHLFASDSVVAQSQKDPTYISLDLSVVNHT